MRVEGTGGRLRPGPVGLDVRLSGTTSRFLLPLVAFLLVGKHLEARARHRATDALETLLALAPPVAVKLDAKGQESLVLTGMLQPGDRVKVTPGSAVLISPATRWSSFRVSALTVARSTRFPATAARTCVAASMSAGEGAGCAGAEGEALAGEGAFWALEVLDTGLPIPG